MSSVKKNFVKQLNLSSGVLDLIMKPWSEVMAKRYAPHLRMLGFCSENGLQPLNADVTNGGEFLIQYFRKSSWIFLVNTARSACYRMFKEKPTFPHYTATWNVKYVLDYVEKCSISSEISFELSSKTLATMTCLLSGQISQTLVFLFIDRMYLNNWE